MKHNPTQKVLMLTLASSVLIAGCASPRSNNQKHDEQFTINPIPLKKYDQTEIKFAGAAIVFEAAIQISKYFIQKEAENYEASSETSYFYQGPLPSPNGTLLVITRTFEDSKHSELPQIKDQESQIASEMASRLKLFSLETTKRNAGESGTPRDYAKALAEQHHLTNRLSFCALVLAQPVSENAMDLTLLGYSYPGLKAKNSAIYVPFTKWNKTKSVLKMTIAGPAGIQGRSLNADFAFSSKLVSWPKDADSKHAASWSPANTNYVSGPVFGDAGTSRTIKYSSMPIFIPDGPVQISANLIESSDMKKTLKTLADKVGGLKLDDFKK